MKHIEVIERDGKWHAYPMSAPPGVPHWMVGHGQTQKEAIGDLVCAFSASLDLDIQFHVVPDMSTVTPRPIPLDGLAAANACERAAEEWQIP